MSLELTMFKIIICLQKVEKNKKMIYNNIISCRGGGMADALVSDASE